MTSVLPTLHSHFSQSGMSNEFNKYSYQDLARVPINNSNNNGTMYPAHFYSSAKPSSESHASSHLDFTPSSNPYYSDSQSLRTSNLDSNLADLAAIAEVKSNDMGLVDSVLSFPTLPADLLDQAPEYEFSTHTRTNVFEAFADISALAFGSDGLPLLDAVDYGSWSGMEHPTVHLGYPHDPSVLDKAEALPRSLDYYVSPSRPTLDIARPDESFEASSDSHPTPHSHAQAVFAAPVVDNLPPNDGRPSVLHPAPEPTLAQPRLSLGYDTMFDSQVGPSRVAVRRAHDPYSANNSPHPYGRSAPQYEAVPFTRQDQRRLSAGGRPHGRDPVVPSQNVGRARMMSWQSERMLAMGGRDGQISAAHAAGFPTDAFGNPQGFGGQDGAAQGIAMTASRSLGYDMQNANGSTAPQLNMDHHGSDMINALGDAMDARIDVDGIAKCPYPNCNKTFAKNRSYNLKAHLRSHSQVKPFSCSVCPRSFSRKHDLERHARVHSGDKPYLCEFCNKGFPRSDALRRHWRVEKECGDKEAALEAGQPLSSVYGDNGGGASESPDSIPSQYQQSMHQQQPQQHKPAQYRSQPYTQQQHPGPYDGHQQQWSDNRR